MWAIRAHPESDKGGSRREEERKDQEKKEVE